MFALFFYMCFYIILALSHIQDCFSVRNYMCGNIRTRQRLTLFQALGDTGWGAADAGYPLLQSKIAGCKIDHECKVLKKEIIAQPTSVSFSRRIYNIHFMNYMKTYQYTCIYVRIYIGSLFIVSCFIGRIRSELEGGVAISFGGPGPRGWAVGPQVLREFCRFVLFLWNVLAPHFTTWCSCIACHFS